MYSDLPLIMQDLLYCEGPSTQFKNLILLSLFNNPNIRVGYTNKYLDEVLEFFQNADIPTVALSA